MEAFNFEEAAFSVAVDELSAIPYFPKNPAAQVTIQEELMRFVHTHEQLHWLIRTAVATMRQWMGVAELRALYATRWRPMDGVEGPPCSLVGFTPGDCEADHQRLQIASQQQKYLPAPEDTQITPEERAEIEKLAERVKLTAARDRERRSVGSQSRGPSPKYLGGDH